MTGELPEVVVSLLDAGEGADGVSTAGDEGVDAAEVSVTAVVEVLPPTLVKPEGLPMLGKPEGPLMLVVVDWPPAGKLAVKLAVKPVSVVLPISVVLVKPVSVVLPISVVLVKPGV